MVARVCKSLGQPEQGYAHRDHRSKKARNWRDKVTILKHKNFKEKIQKRTEQELAREEAKELFIKQKHDSKI